jgi:ATP-dependent Clp protease adapter protein ClpS
MPFLYSITKPKQRKHIVANRNLFTPNFVLKTLSTPQLMPHNHTVDLQTDVHPRGMAFCMSSHLVDGQRTK